MIVYVVFGGMLATTWVQIIKAILLMSGTIFLSVLVMKHFDFSFAKFFDAIAHVTVDGCRPARSVTKDFLEPGLIFGATVTNGWGPLDLISLGLALIFGTAGLPHILVRFYTVPDAKTARVSVVWAMIIIGALLHHDDVPRLRRGDDPRRRRTSSACDKHERAAARRTRSAAKSSSPSSARSPSPRSSRSSPA